MLFDILGWLIIGLIIGAIARLLTPGEGKMGCLATSLLGIVGSIVGGLISRFFFGAPNDTYMRPGFIISVFGAILVLFTARLFRGNT